MKPENLRSFIVYGVDEEMPQGKIIVGGLSICALPCIIAIAGIERTNTIWMSVLIYLLSLSFLVTLFKASQNLDLKKRIFCSMVISIATTVLFSLSAAIILVKEGIPYGGLVCLIPTVLGIISFLVVYGRLRLNGYLNKKNNPKYKNLTVAALIGTGLSMWGFGDKLFARVEAMLPEGAYGSILALIIASVFAIMGAPTILKLYYLHKLESSTANK